VPPSISVENVNLDKDAVGGPILARSATDLDAEWRAGRRVDRQHVGWALRGSGTA